jgi:hypothetical protein
MEVLTFVNTSLALKYQAGLSSLGKYITLRMELLHSIEYMFKMPNQQNVSPRDEEPSCETWGLLTRLSSSLSVSNHIIYTIKWSHSVFCFCSCKNMTTQDLGLPNHVVSEVLFGKPALFFFLCCVSSVLWTFSRVGSASVMDWWGHRFPEVLSQTSQVKLVKKLN